jgi:uncharacterized RDD family membrane protein YckC
VEIKEEISQSDIKERKPIPLEFAPAWKRVLAYTIDLLILGLILDLMLGFAYRGQLTNIMELNDFNSIYKAFTGFMDAHSFQLFIATFALQGAYFTLSWSSRGQSLGAFFLKIVVITIEKKRLSLPQAFFRYCLVALSSIGFYLIMIFVFNPVFRQRFHDFLTNTVVVNIPEIDNDDKEDNESDAG